MSRDSPLATQQISIQQVASMAHTGVAQRCLNAPVQIAFTSMSGLKNNHATRLQLRLELARQHKLETA